MYYLYKLQLHKDMFLDIAKSRKIPFLPNFENDFDFDC
jgi:hypothetical protein